MDKNENEDKNTNNSSSIFSTEKKKYSQNIRVSIGNSRDIQLSLENRRDIIDRFKFILNKK